MDLSGHRVAVVGADRGIPGTVRRLGGSVVEPANADLVVAVDEAGFRRAALAAPETPLLAVTTGDVHYATSVDDAAAAIEAVLTGDRTLVDHPIVGVTVDGERVGRVLLEVTLLTSEPARISEYGVATDGTTLQTFRADAVTVATPAGSAGYARAAGGPVVRPNAGLAVVPVASFTTHADTLVLPGPVTLSVERDDEPVSIVVDGDDRGTVPTHAPIVVRTIDHVPVVSPAPRVD
ncbi:NAD(+)/NADH kinase [Halopenitus persicus]|uniref:NAD+ kinase n=1 Tax=Halopenitus persicus TaxID=1048396 RepID=A0A1H3ISQ7_9EURY|nr:NAD(+)/NADH kinase [Halopenitus persicus]SDY29904.1 NAD+ kinase [Halopenitus persicus]